MSTTTPKKPGGTAVTFPRRLTYYDDDRGIALVNALAQRRGMKAAQFLRQLVREEAERKGVDPAE